VAALHIVLDRTAESVAVHVRHHHVADDEVGAIFPCHGQSFLPVGGGEHGEFLSEKVFHERAELLVVFGHQDGDFVSFGHRGFGCFLCVGKLAFDGDLGIGGGSLWWLGRQQQREARAFSRCAFHRDFSFVQVHITFDQVQSDTAAGIHGMALCAFALVETHEDVFQVFRRDAYAGVADGDADAVGAFACRGTFLPTRLYGDETAFGGELHGVGKQVVQHACHLFGIQTEQVFLPESTLAGQSDVPFVSELAEMVHVVFDERFDLHGQQF